MQLIYSNPEETTITVTLDEGEWLGDLIGPTVAHVPTDPMNRHYDEILYWNYVVDAYAAPAAPQPTDTVDNLLEKVRALEARLVNLQV
jgi:hypothetical protein